MTKADDAVKRVEAFLDLRNKRAEGSQENIASLVNDHNCVLHLKADNIRTILAELQLKNDAYNAAVHNLAIRIEECEDQAAEIERLRGVIVDLAISLNENLDDDPCWTDHHGYCQAHHLDDVSGGGCRVENGRNLYDKIKAEFIEADAEQALKGEA